MININVNAYRYRHRGRKRKEKEKEEWELQIEFFKDISSDAWTSAIYIWITLSVASILQVTCMPIYIWTSAIYVWIARRYYHKCIYYHIYMYMYIYFMTINRLQVVIYQLQTYIHARKVHVYAYLKRHACACAYT